MKAVPEPFIKVLYALEFELAYDSFKGQTPVEIADMLEEEVLDVVSELRPDILGISISTTELETVNV